MMSGYLENIGSVTAQGFIPLIKFSTRFSDLRGILNDNFLYKISARSSNTTSGIMIRKFSGHQPYFTCLDLTSHYVKPPRLINICKIYCHLRMTCYQIICWII